MCDCCIRERGERAQLPKSRKLLHRPSHISSLVCPCRILQWAPRSRRMAAKLRRRVPGRYHDARILSADVPALNGFPESGATTYPGQPLRMRSAMIRFQCPECGMGDSRDRAHARDRDPLRRLPRGARTPHPPPLLGGRDRSGPLARRLSRRLRPRTASAPLSSWRCLVQLFVRLCPRLFFSAAIRSTTLLVAICGSSAASIPSPLSFASISARRRVS